MTTNIRITIGRRLTMVDRILTSLLFPVSICAVPIINETLLGGNWVISAIAAIFGFIAFIAIIHLMRNHTGCFKTLDEAAEWVKSIDLEKLE